MEQNLNVIKLYSYKVLLTDNMITFSDQISLYDYKVLKQERIEIYI